MTDINGVKKVVLAYSGGLDTSVIIPWLKENYGCEVIACTVNLGQPEDFDAIHEKALKSGASVAETLDVRKEFIEEYAYNVLKADGIYEGKYLLGTSFARPLIGKCLVDMAKKYGADAICHGATGKGNLLELSVAAAKARASLGEISLACEKVFGRYKAVIRSISGVYEKELMKDKKNAEIVSEISKLIKKFEEKEGRKPRILIAKMGQDGHDRGAKVVGTAYADLGFDVDMGPLFQTPEETAKMAVENDVHVVAMSSLAAGHKTLLPALVEELKKLGREDIMIIVGGVIPAQDYKFLLDHGASAIFGPGTVIPESAKKILELLLA